MTISPTEVHHGQDATGGGVPEDRIVRACVCSGNLSIPYVQAGEGSPVLLLSPTAGTGLSKTLLFRILSRHFRVVAPTRPSGGEPYAAGEPPPRVALSRLLREFLDGLGLGRVGVVAEEPFGVAALGFALMENERVGGLVLAFEDEPDRTSLVGVVGTVAAEAEWSVMMVKRGAGPLDADPCREDWQGGLVPFLSRAAEPLPEDA